MQCPVCNDTKLQMMERQGIEVDYCPDCRGVWLDRGELDKILERSAADTGGIRVPGSGRPREDHKGYGKRKKRQGLLGELFDF